MTVDFTKIKRYDEECQTYFGNELIQREEGEYVRFDDVVEILKNAGIKFISYETIRSTEFEAKMEHEFGRNWRM